MKPKVIGMTGTSGSGKTTAAAYLKKRHGFYPIILSDYIKKELEAVGEERIDKVKLQTQGNKMRTQHGGSVMAKFALAEIKKKDKQKIVIDGIRTVFEIEYLRKHTDFYLLGIDADIKKRLERRNESGKPKIKSLKEFVKVEHRDSKLGSNKVGLRVQDCLEQVDVLIYNNESMSRFLKLLDWIARL